MLFNLYLIFVHWGITNFKLLILSQNYPLFKYIFGSANIRQIAWKK